VKREKIEHVPENMEQGMGRNEQESRTENLESDIFTKKFKVGDKILNYNELLKIADDQKSTFSPNVLLRPVFQDSILPNAAYIAGPGEIGYSLQIKDLYDYFDVPMPAFISRHSATFLDRRTVRFFETHSTQEKQETEIGNREIINDNNSQFQIPNSKHLKPELSYTYFMRDFGDISKELTSEIINKDVESHLKEIEGQFHELYVKLAGIASEIDKSLDGTVKSTEQKSMQSYEHIIKKIISAQKKRNSEIFEKYEQTYNLIFPSKTLQERIYSPLNIINYIGIEAFIDFLLQIFEDDYKEHFIIGL